jgi:hypothetical protein
MFKKIEMCAQRLVSDYIDTVSQKYNIQQDELKDLFYKGEGLKRLSKGELVSLCKSKGLKTTGTKEALISVITNHENFSKKKSLLNKLKENQSHIYLSKYPIGEDLFYIHTETGLIFNQDKIVIGVEKDGEIASLTPYTIQQAKKYKFDYLLPINLNEMCTPSLKKIEGFSDIEDYSSGEETEEETTV